jgi:hypothetical protein
MLKNNYTTEEKPNCFGKMYAASAPECVGGHDPAYLNEENGTRVRDRCNFASSCAAQMQAYRNAGTPVHVPVTNLTRPVTSFTPTSPIARPPWAPPPQAPVQPQHWQHSAQQMMPINHYMPQYLTVRQPVIPGQSMAKRLLIESGRSVCKSLGHTIAHFFDVEIFGPGGNKPNGG